MTIKSESLADLTHVAESIIQEIGDKKIVAFYGQMGAGKTTLIKEICSALGVSDVVSSPTFSLVNEYSTPEGNPIYHFDFYRINKIEEAYDFGYEEYFYGGNLCLIEWPECIEELIPDTALKISITVNDDDTRTIQVA